MHKDRLIFLKLSSELTGYSSVDLEGTGLVDDYWKLLNGEFDPSIIKLLIYTAKTVVNQKSEKMRDENMHINILASSTLWPICESLITLWYRGQWTSMSAFWYKYYGVAIPNKVTPGKTIVPSAKAYTQQLSYHAAGAHPPGAKPTGYGSWRMDPVFGDFTNNKKDES